MRAGLLAGVWIGLSVACFTDTGASGSGETDGCKEGGGGCACYGNGTCDEGFTCDAGLEICVSETCSLGMVACPCDDGECQLGLTCDGGLCVVEVESTGTRGVTSQSGTGGSAGATGSGTGTSTDGPSSTGGTVASEVVLYFTAADDGLLAGPPSSGLDVRAETDSMCIAAMQALARPCNDAAAVLSASGTDAVSTLDVMHGVPFNVPVVSDTGQTIAENFDLLLSNGPDITLVDAGVSFVDSGGNPAFYPTASDPSGAFNALGSCEGWTEPTGNSLAAGDPNLIGGWLSGYTAPCNLSFDPLCACWSAN